jgi:hypothetical protein
MHCSTKCCVEVSSLLHALTAWTLEKFQPQNLDYERGPTWIQSDRMLKGKIPYCTNENSALFTIPFNFSKHTVFIKIKIKIKMSTPENVIKT